MAVNDILTVADGGSANVLSQGAYAALTAYLDAGFSTGIVPSNRINKTIRQSTLMAYVLAQHIVNLTGLDVLDNGTPATILANLSTAIRNTVTTAYAGNPNGHVAGTAATPGSVAPSTVWDTVNRIFWICTTTGNAASAVWFADTGNNGVVYCGLATGTANAIVLTPAVPVPAYAAGLALSFIVAAANTNAVTVNVSGLGAINLYKEGPTGPIALTGGELAAGNLVSARHDGTRLQLTATEMGTAALANASSNTGTVAAVTGGITSGHLAVFSDTFGTLQDGGLPGTAAAPTYLDHSFNNQVMGSGVYAPDPSTAAGGAFTIKLPAVPANGQSLQFQDTLLNWGTPNAFTVDGNGNTITAPLGVDTTVVCVSRGLTFKVQWSSALNTWEMS